MQHRRGENRKEGSLVKKGTEVIQLLSCPIDNVLDTTGAGDFYAAGFMYGLTCGYSLEKCVQISTIWPLPSFRKSVPPYLLRNGTKLS